MVEMVNGYRCANCTDISNAKRGLDPENPTGDPVKQEKLDREAGRLPDPAVVFEGALAALRAGKPVADGAVPWNAAAVATPTARLLDMTA